MNRSKGTVDGAEENDIPRTHHRPGSNTVAGPTVAASMDRFRWHEAPARLFMVVYSWHSRLCSHTQANIELIGH
jgi:hypothetical protein